jgi:hypothetical protein
MIIDTPWMPNVLGGGDVAGPASATDNAVARFDGTTGKLIQNSTVTIADTTGAIAGASSLTAPAATGSTVAAPLAEVAHSGRLVGWAVASGVTIARAKTGRKRVEVEQPDTPQGRRSGCRSLRVTWWCA